MAIEGFQMRDIVRTKKQNIVAVAAYNSRTNIYDRTEETMKYHHTSTKDHIGKTIMYLPENAPKKYNHPEELWNDIQAMKYDNQGKRMILNLPAEASFEQQQEMVDLFVRTNLLSQHLVCQVDFHNEKIKGSKGNKNFHAHILCTELQLINGQWADVKSRSPYVDEAGNELQKIDTPRLKNKRLQYDSNGIIYKKGWQKLQFNKDGSPMLHEDGTPVLVDIRSPLLDENGKQIIKDDRGTPAPQWLRKKKSDCNINQMGIVKKLRMNWGDCQNTILKKYNIKDKDGNDLTIDMRSYKERDKDQPKDLKRIPQVKVYDPDDPENESIVKLNTRIKAHNETVMEIRHALEEKAKIHQDVNAILEEETADKSYIESFDFKKDWMENWVLKADELQKNIISFYNLVNRKLQETMRETEKKYHELQDTGYDKIEKDRIARHYQLMLKLEGKLKPESLTPVTKINRLANDSWDNLTDQKRVAFVRNWYSIDTAKTYARVLARDKNDLNIIDGLRLKGPYVPMRKTNHAQTAKAAKALCKTDNLEEYIRTALDKWNSGNFEAPPQEIINIINTYATLDRYYTCILTGKKWATQNIIAGMDYNPAGIEAKAQAEMAALRAEQARQAELEKRAKEKAQREAELIRRTEEERRMYVQANWQKLVPQFQVAVKNNDRDSIMKISALVKDAFGNNTIQVKYSRACQDRDQEHENMLHRYAELHRHEELNRMEKLPQNQGRYISDREAELSLENQFITKNNKINARKLNAVILEHNQKARYESDVIETKKYREYADETNFWYCMIHLEQAIRQTKENAVTLALENGRTSEMPIEIRYSPDTKQNRAPAAKNATVPGTVSQNDKNGASILPSGIGKDVNIRGGWKEKDDDHEKSVMEITEEEMKKGWDPNKKGPSL